MCLPLGTTGAVFHEIMTHVAVSLLLLVGPSDLLQTGRQIPSYILSTYRYIIHTLVVHTLGT